MASSPPESGRTRANSSPPVTGHGILLSGDFPENAGDSLKKGIAEGMSECVVDFLEIVDVDDQEGETGGFLPFAPNDLGGQKFPEHPLVEEPGERVPDREVFKFPRVGIDRLDRADHV